MLYLSDLGFPVLALIVMNFSALIWGTHGYPYPSCHSSGERSFEEVGGFWPVINKYCLFDRVTGKSLRDFVSPKRGFVWGGLISLFVLVFIWFAIIVWTVMLGSSEHKYVWFYIVAISVIIFLLFPEMFVRYANLPGKVTDIPEDFPFSLMLWGGAISPYAALLILRSHSIDTIPLIGLSTDVISKKWLFVWPLTIMGLAFGAEKCWLNPQPKMRTWRIFFTSWLIATLGCWGFALFLSV